MDVPPINEAPLPRKQRNNKYLRWTPRMDSGLANVLQNQHFVGYHSLNCWKAPIYTMFISAIKMIMR